ncbi:MAG: hypothetical protein ACK4SY_09140 [Pyrobaculum sp.]
MKCNDALHIDMDTAASRKAVTQWQPLETPPADDSWACWNSRDSPPILRLDGVGDMWWRR